MHGQVRACLISIHVLREEDDKSPYGPSITTLKFQSTSSARRTTQPTIIRGLFFAHFNPHPPRGGRQSHRASEPWCSWISIHVLREEDDALFLPVPCTRSDFNPRPPRGGRLRLLLLWALSWYFNPRPPRGGRRCSFRWRFELVGISIHVLREEDDRVAGADAGNCRYFNPRPPRGGRLPGAAVPLSAQTISIHVLREEDDAVLAVQRHSLRHFNPRPPRGGRRLSLSRPESSRAFQSTSSARRTTISGKRKNSWYDFNPRPPRGGRHQ